MSDSRSSLESNLARAKKAAKWVLSRFGPHIVTGFLAAAEHYLTKPQDDDDDDDERKEEAPDPRSHRNIEDGDRNPLQDSQRGNRWSTRRQHSFSDPDLITSADPPPPPPLQRSPRLNIFSFQDREASYYQPARDQEPRGEWRERRYPSPRRRSSSSPGEHLDRRCSRTGDDQSPRRLLRRHTHRRHSISHHDHYHHRPRRRRRRRSAYASAAVDDDTRISDRAAHAGRVAAVAGMVEALHVGDRSEGEGDGWAGAKGLRVGTAAAATYGAVYSRGERGLEGRRRRDVILDVGTGLLVSRLVHGSSRYLDGREGVDRRRWSYWY